MKNIFKSAVSILALVIGMLSPVARAQNEGFSTTQLTMPLFSVNLNPVSNASAALVGAQGPQNYCYWLVTNYLLGSLSPVLAGCVINAPNTLGSSNYDYIAWQLPTGAVSVDVLRNSSSLTAPSGACACAVGTAITSPSNIKDQSNSLSAYTVPTPAIPNNFNAVLQNEVQSSGVSHLILRQGPPGGPLAFISDLSTGTSGTLSLDTNSTPNLNQTVLNFTDTATIGFTNPSGGVESAALKNTTVTPGSYTNLNATIDAQGRITLAANGSPGGSNIEVNGGSALSSPVNFQNGTTGNVINFLNPSGSSIQATIQAASVTSAMLANTTVTPASYTSANITVNAEGQITAASNGTGGGNPVGTLGFTLTGTGASSSFTAQWLDASQQPTGDFCAKAKTQIETPINSVTSQLVSGLAFINSSIACALAPFAITDSGILQLPAGLIAAQTVPFPFGTGMIMHGTSGINGSNTGTTIQAQNAASGFTPSPILLGGNSGTGNQFRLGADFINLDANNLAGVGCLESDYAEELSFWNQLNCVNTLVGYSFGFPGSGNTHLQHGGNLTNVDFSARNSAGPSEALATNLAITSVSSTGGVATAVVSSTLGLYTSHQAQISGVPTGGGGTNYNSGPGGIYITVTDGTHFTYNILPTSVDSAGSGGTVNAYPMGLRILDHDAGLRDFRNITIGAKNSNNVFPANVAGFDVSGLAVVTISNIHVETFPIGGTVGANAPTSGVTLENLDLESGSATNCLQTGLQLSNAFGAPINIVILNLSTRGAGGSCVSTPPNTLVDGTGNTFTHLNNPDIPWAVYDGNGFLHILAADCPEMTTGRCDDGVKDLLKQSGNIAYSLNDVTGSMVINEQNVGQVGLTVNNPLGSTSDIAEFKTNGVTLASVDQSGDVTIFGGAIFTAHGSTSGIATVGASPTGSNLYLNGSTASITTTGAGTFAGLVQTAGLQATPTNTSVLGLLVNNPLGTTVDIADFRVNGINEAIIDNLGDFSIAGYLELGSNAAPTGIASKSLFYHVTTGNRPGFNPNSTGDFRFVGVAAGALGTSGHAMTFAANGIDATDGGALFSPTITSPASTQTLTYNGSAWVNGYGGVSVDAQTGNYTFSCPTDRLGEIEFNISSAATLTLPQAGSTACLGSSMALVVRNTSTSTAILTISATTSTFQPEAVSTLSIIPGAGVFIYSDATSSTGNYHDLGIATPYGGVNTQTANYTLTLLDKDKLVVMNCSSACAASLPASPPSTKWNSGVISIGSTTATLSLNSLNYNGGATAPVLLKYQPLFFRTDGSNYFGDVPLVAGSNVTLTPSANGLTVAATGSGGANTALSNLAAVSINTSLLAQTGVDLGSTSNAFRNLYLFGGGTYGTDSFEITGTSTANRTVTLPDNTGTVAELNLAETFSALQTFGTNISIGGVTATGATGTGNVVFSAAPTLTGTTTLATLAATTINGAAFSGTFTGAPTFSGNIAFTGTPTFSNALALGSSTATTQTACDNSTKLATTAYTGIACNTVQTSGSPFSLTAQSQTQWNNTSGAYVWDLPATSSGLQVCIGNYKTVAQAISLVPPSGSTIYYKGVAGTTSSSTGIVSGGAAGDFICVEAVDSTTWEVIGAGQGVWTNN